MVCKLSTIETAQCVVEGADEALVNAVSLESSQVGIRWNRLGSVSKLESANSEFEPVGFVLQAHERLPQNGRPIFRCPLERK
jgi:hypothetical protein